MLPADKELLPLNGHTDAVYSVCFSPDGKRILTGSADNTAKIWDAYSVRTASLKRTYQACDLRLFLSRRHTHPYRKRRTTQQGFGTLRTERKFCLLAAPMDIPVM